MGDNLESRLKLRFSDFIPVVGLLNYNSRVGANAQEIRDSNAEQRINYLRGAAGRSAVLMAWNLVPWVYSVVQFVRDT